MNEHGSGMVPPGKWVHKVTGKEIIVRDCFQDGDQMVVMTNEGQLTMKEFSNYIQLEEGETIPNISDLYGNMSNGSLMAMINKGIDKEDQIKPDLNPKMRQITQPLLEDNNILTEGLSYNDNNKKPIIKENPNYKLIKKVFDKFPVERSVEFQIFKEEWPIKEFNMLVNVLDVPLQDICEYIIENYLSKENLAKYLSSFFEEYIDKK